MKRKPRNVKVLPNVMYCAKLDLKQLKEFY